MSLTSYRAAPPRDTEACLWPGVVVFEIVKGSVWIHADFKAWRRPTLPLLEH